MISTPKTLALSAAFLAAAALSAPATAECLPDTYFSELRSLPSGTNPLFSVVADFNADGLPDMAVANSNFLGGGSSSLAVFRGLGGGNFAAPDLYVSGNQPHGIVAADFDEDGALDLAVANTFSSAVHIHRGLKTAGVPNGTFGAGASFLTAGQPFQIVTGDYNEDGILDIAAAINNIARVSVLIGQGAGGVGNGSFAAAQTYPLANLSVAIEQADFDADGILDLVATEYIAGTVAVLRGQGIGGVGNGTFAPASHVAAGPEPFDLAVLDFDEDGIQDLAVANSNSGGVRLLRGLGGGVLVPFGSLASGNTAVVAPVDLNQDGILDLVTAQTAGARQLRIYLGNGVGGVGDGTYSEKPPVPTSTDPYQIVVTELNGDTFPDLVIPQFLANDVTIAIGGCAEPTPDLRFPVLTDVRDVPHDQGGRVYVTWLASSLDAPLGPVTSYRVWRRIPPLAAGAVVPDASRTRGPITTRSERGPDGATLVTYWESIATLPAERLEGYGYTAPTTEDSTRAHPVSTAFFISALTSNINVSYPSNVDSGASIDNLVPSEPFNLRIDPAAPSFLRVLWSPVPDPDLRSYRVYAGPTADFAVAEGLFLDEVADTSYVVPGGAAGSYYRVTAVDFNGNEGPPSVALGQGVVGIGAVPLRLALAGPRPNPARGSEVRLVLTLATDEPAELGLFDVTGRRVAAPSLSGLGRGEHAVRLDASRRLRAGIYWIRLSQGGNRVEQKMVLLND